MTETIWAVGDIHGNTRWCDQLLRECSKAGITTIIQVGDLGVLWPSGGNGSDDKFTRLLVRWLRQYGITMFFVDGNHDVHPRLRALPKNAEGFGVIDSHLLYAPRGHRWTLSGRSFGALGGAMSVDRQWRTEGRSFWLEETILESEVDRLGVDGPLDVLISHDVPAGVSGLASGLADALPENVAYMAYQQRVLIAEAVTRTRPRLNLCGHWHQRHSAVLASTGTRVEVLDRDGQLGSVVAIRLDDLSTREVNIKPL